MRKKICLFILAVAIFLLVWEIADFQNAVRPNTVPSVDLTELADKQTLTEEDYRIIFLQTGLGKPAVCDLQKSDNFLQVLQKFQQQRQEKHEYRRGFVFFPTTTAELLVDSKGHERTLILPPLRDGDILITKSTKTMIYRHGHAAICIDGEGEKVAEAMTFGSPSAITQIDSWTSYATLMILRPQAENETIEKAIDFTRKKLIRIPYSLGVGLLEKDKSQKPAVDATHCSHLVWQAYKASGLDIDSDGGWLVSPRDISRSSNLELVFSFGFGEEGTWS